MSESKARPGRSRRVYAVRVPAEQRQAQLLDAALHLVATRGHQAVTMDAVAERVGVSKPVVYGHFSSRGDLLAALLYREHSGALRQLRDTVPVGRLFSGEDPAEAAIEMFGGYLRAVRESPDRWYCIVMPMPDLPIEFHASRERARLIVLDQARQVLGRVLGGHGVDAELAAHAVIALGEMAARLLLTDPERFTPERFEAALRIAVSPGPG
jgi:AcrR family transcriptional regulator